MQATVLKVAETIDIEDFQKVNISTGTIISATPNARAKKPAYKLTIDFGILGIKTSSAQLMENYTPEMLIGQQIVAVMNFPAKQIAGVKSDVLVLAAVCAKQGTMLLTPTSPVENGMPVS